MAEIVTLDGLKAERPGGACGKTVTVDSPTLNRAVSVCWNDAEAISKALEGLRTRKGRPRGTTAAKGARKPKVTKCTDPKMVKGRCKCTTKGNSQFLPRSACR